MHESVCWRTFRFPSYATAHDRTDERRLPRTERSSSRPTIRGQSGQGNSSTSARADPPWMTSRRANRAAPGRFTFGALRRRRSFSGHATWLQASNRFAAASRIGLSSEAMAAARCFPCDAGRAGRAASPPGLFGLRPVACATDNVRGEEHLVDRFDDRHRVRLCSLWWAAGSLGAATFASARP